MRLFKLQAFICNLPKQAMAAALFKRRKELFPTISCSVCTRDVSIAICHTPVNRPINEVVLSFRFSIPALDSFISTQTSISLPKQTVFAAFLKRGKKFFPRIIFTSITRRTSNTALYALRNLPVDVKEQGCNIRPLQHHQW